MIESDQNKLFLFEKEAGVDKSESVIITAKDVPIYSYNVQNKIWDEIDYQGIALLICRNPKCAFLKFITTNNNNIKLCGRIDLNKDVLIDQNSSNPLILTIISQSEELVFYNLLLNKNDDTIKLAKTINRFHEKYLMMKPIRSSFPNPPSFSLNSNQNNRSQQLNQNYRSNQQSNMENNCTNIHIPPPPPVQSQISPPIQIQPPPPIQIQPPPPIQIQPPPPIQIQPPPSILIPPPQLEIQPPIQIQSPQLQSNITIHNNNEQATALLKEKILSRPAPPSAPPQFNAPPPLIIDQSQNQHDISRQINGNLLPPSIHQQSWPNTQISGPPPIPNQVNKPNLHNYQAEPPNIPPPPPPPIDTLPKPTSNPYYNTNNNCHNNINIATNHYDLPPPPPPRSNKPHLPNNIPQTPPPITNTIKKLVDNQPPKIPTNNIHENNSNTQPQQKPARANFLTSIKSFNKTDLKKVSSPKEDEPPPIPTQQKPVPQNLKSVNTPKPPVNFLDSIKNFNRTNLNKIDLTTNSTPKSDDKKLDLNDEIKNRFASLKKQKSESEDDW